MSSILTRNKTKNIAHSGWIDELSEEEEKVLKHGAAIDAYMKSKKSSKLMKVGMLDDIGVEE